jgi:hypothetical protein
MDDAGEIQAKQSSSIDARRADIFKIGQNHLSLKKYWMRHT